VGWLIKYLNSSCVVSDKNVLKMRRKGSEKWCETRKIERPFKVRRTVHRWSLNGRAKKLRRVGSGAKRIVFPFSPAPGSEYLNNITLLSRWKTSRTISLKAVPMDKNYICHYH
jgi:hypothetical protein